jgi:hypothetical protein
LCIRDRFATTDGDGANVESVRILAP